MCLRSQADVTIWRGWRVRFALTGLAAWLGLFPRIALRSIVHPRDEGPSLGTPDPGLFSILNTGGKTALGFCIDVEGRGWRIMLWLYIRHC